MRYTVRPISDRTAFTGKHERSRFDSTWTATERLLLAEVAHLAGRNLVLEVDVQERHIRLDGGLYANARPATPAVRVAFDSMHGPLTYATDRFTGWQDNVRAIALGLEALRKVDRYGITKRGEQYAGWKALPGGTGGEASRMTREEAIYLLDEYTDRDWAAGDPADVRHVHRRARAAAHPDRHNGDRTLWNKVEQAAKVLGVLS
ncbi:hypothetical protein [Nocardioides pakistanensis]